MSRLPRSTRYVGTLSAACVMIGLSLMLVLPAPQSVATEETPVVARFEPQATTETLRFQPGDFDITRMVPVRIKAPEAAAQGSTPAPEAPADEGGRPAMLAADGVNLRSGPNVGSRRLDVLEGGIAVRVLETERSWSRIVTEDGRTGWLASKFLAG